jgi:hypothetical protein
MCPEFRAVASVEVDVAAVLVPNDTFIIESLPLKFREFGPAGKIPKLPLPLELQLSIFTLDLKEPDT